MRRFILIIQYCVQEVNTDYCEINRSLDQKQCSIYALLFTLCHDTINNMKLRYIANFVTTKNLQIEGFKI